VSSVAVPVATVDAASKAGEAGNSIDDDETTKWTSEPGQGAAITYRLARPALLTEAVLKLSGWRERSYPLRITVDGVEVYKGSTPKSLGYVHLPLKPHKGSAVRIALEGSVDEAGAIKLTEVANQANADTGANNTSKAVLAIVEAEFHENP
jgi:beta-galactosidase